jgi:hypothetical protein
MTRPAGRPLYGLTERGRVLELITLTPRGWDWARIRTVTGLIPDGWDTWYPPEPGDRERALAARAEMLREARAARAEARREARAATAKRRPSRRKGADHGPDQRPDARGTQPGDAPDPAIPAEGHFRTPIGRTTS